MKPGLIYKYLSYHVLHTYHFRVLEMGSCPIKLSWDLFVLVWY